jgi:hypothetical protein
LGDSSENGKVEFTRAYLFIELPKQTKQQNKAKQKYVKINFIKHLEKSHRFTATK